MHCQSVDDTIEIYVSTTSEKINSDFLFFAQQKQILLIYEREFVTRGPKLLYAKTKHIFNIELIHHFHYPLTLQSYTSRHTQHDTEHVP